jgi:hypothetical protein
MPTPAPRLDRVMMPAVERRLDAGENQPCQCIEEVVPVAQPRFDFPAAEHALFVAQIAAAGRDKPDRHACATPRRPYYATDIRVELGARRRQPVERSEGGRKRREQRLLREDCTVDFGHEVDSFRRDAPLRRMG